MKKLFMAVIALMMTISAYAQFNIYCSDGNVIKVDSISMVAPEDIGSFSVSATKKVTFSPGNLQYHPANDEWRFAENQTDYIGAANANISSTNYGWLWLDLFGWGTGNNPTNSSTDYNDYQTFVDWGANQIGSDAPNTWRTLTYDEWYYLLNTRANASSLKGVAQVNGVNGLILLPDNWTCPAGVTLRSGFYGYGGVDYSEYQTFTALKWFKLESAGAVFLPAAGSRRGSNVDYVQNYGKYWSATEFNSNGAIYFYFCSDASRVDGNLRYYGYSVRLVKDLMMTISDSAQFYIYCSDGNVIKVDSISMVAPEEPEEPTPPAGIGSFSVSATKKITFSPGNLQYHPANNKWRFAENQTDYIGDANRNISPTYNGWLDSFGWGTGNNPTNSSTDYNDYQTFVDWGANQIDSDAPNTWRTLTYDEWEYLLNYRPNASSHKGVAHVNGVNGLILLPDNWTCPAGVTFRSGFHRNGGVDYYAAYQTFTASEWSKLEAAGAVFLPAAGIRRYGSNVYGVQGSGYYWSATEHNGNDARYLDFYANGADMHLNYPRYYGVSVRLVKDLQ